MPRATALASSTGWTAGSPAGSRLDAPPPFGTQMRAAVARSPARGRVASVIADNLRTHTVAGARLVRRMLHASSGQLCLSSTPADDPDANRIVWLWRISRRAVTQNHHRDAWDGLHAAFEQHVRRLASARIASCATLAVPSRRMKDTLPRWRLPHDPCGSIWQQHRGHGQPRPMRRSPRPHRDAVGGHGPSWLRVSLADREGGAGPRMLLQRLPMRPGGSHSVIALRPGVMWGACQLPWPTTPW